MHGTPTCHYSPTRRPPCQGHLPRGGLLRVLVQQVLAPLFGVWCGGSLRPHPGQPPRRPAHSARTGAHHPLHPPATPSPCLAGQPVQPDRGRCHPRRTQGPECPSAAQRAHHRARATTQRLDHAPGPPGAVATTPGLPPPAGARLQRPPRGRSGRADLPERPWPPLLHLGGQGCLRRRPLPAPGRFPPHGRSPLVPRRALEGPGPAGAVPVPQRSLPIPLVPGTPLHAPPDPLVPPLPLRP